MVSADVIVFDNVDARMKLISLVEASRPDALQAAREMLEARARQLDAAVPRIPDSSANQPVEESDFESAYGRGNFMDAVERIREYIKAGDVMQVVLSQRMSIPFASPPINLYRALRGLNPSPYMYFMNLDDFHIVSSSPEILARVENGVIVNRPLAGTRPARSHRCGGSRDGAGTHQRSQGDRRAPDADRPRAQRRRPGLEDSAASRSPSSSSWSAIPTSCTCRPTWSANSRMAARPSTCSVRRCRSAPCPARRRSARWRSSTNSNR